MVCDKETCHQKSLQNLIQPKSSCSCAMSMKHVAVMRSSDAFTSGRRNASFLTIGLLNQPRSSSPIEKGFYRHSEGKTVRKQSQILTNHPFLKSHCTGPYQKRSQYFQLNINVKKMEIDLEKYHFKINFNELVK